MISQKDRCMTMAQHSANNSGKPHAVLNLNTIGAALYVVREWQDDMAGRHSLVARVEPVDAYTVFEAADKAWQAELARQFGKRAGDVRYTPEGRGIPSTELRRLYTAFCEARDAWEATQR